MPISRVYVVVLRGDPALFAMLAQFAAAQSVLPVYLRFSAQDAAGTFLQESVFFERAVAEGFVITARTLGASMISLAAVGLEL